MISVEDISRLLPHRFPFLLIDRVIDFIPEKSIVALKNVTCNEQFFQGHFPDWKIMPGVLIIEAIAQAGAVLLFNSIPDPDRKFILLSKLDKAKFKKMVTPGDQIRIEVHWIRRKGRIFQMKGKALVEGEVAAEAEIFATVLDIEELADIKKGTAPSRPCPCRGILTGPPFVAGPDPNSIPIERRMGTVPLDEGADLPKNNPQAYGPAGRHPERAKITCSSRRGSPRGCCCK